MQVLQVGKHKFTAPCPPPPALPLHMAGPLCVIPTLVAYTLPAQGSWDRLAGCSCATTSTRRTTTSPAWSASDRGSAGGGDDRARL